MNPIYEKGTGEGVGHSLKTFLRRFNDICDDHVNSGRATAFAFIFYDFCDSSLQTILRDQGVFAQLDRLAGKKLTIFYLHTGSKHAVTRFNREFLKKLDIERDVRPPCVVFFKIADETVHDIAAFELDHTDLIHGFKELYDVIRTYVEGAALHKSKVPNWARSAMGLVSRAALEEVIKHALGSWM